VKNALITDVPRDFDSWHADVAGKFHAGANRSGIFTLCDRSDLIRCLDYQMEMRVVHIQEVGAESFVALRPSKANPKSAWRQGSRISVLRRVGALASWHQNGLASLPLSKLAPTQHRFIAS